MIQTETHYRGDTIPLTITLRQEDGVPYDLSDCRVWLSIPHEGACLTVAGTVSDPLLGTVLFAGADLDLPPRARRTSVIVEWADGAVETVAEFALLTMEHC